METARVRTVVLDVPGWAGHRAGQHVDVRLTADDGYQAQRSYSIASGPEDSRLELTVERLDDGEVSPYLADELREGDVLELRGPVGGYFVWEEALGGPLLLVAGGSGIVPVRAMLRHHRAVASSVPVRLLYSVRGFGDVIYRDELLALASSRDADIDVMLTLTRERPDGWHGFARRVDGPMLAEAGWAADDRPLTYVCGPSALVETVAELLVAAGHDPARVRTERFGGTFGGTGENR
jgi:ferredoxin-NADP reductase